MLLNLGCLSVDLQMKWNIKPFWKKKVKAEVAKDSDKTKERDNYYYISYDSYDNLTAEEYKYTEDLHYACSSPSSSCSHGASPTEETSSGYEELQAVVRPVPKFVCDQYWNIGSELLLVECC